MHLVMAKPYDKHGLRRTEGSDDQQERDEGGMQTGTLDDKTSIQKREGTRPPTHQRLWWTELARGIITCAAGLLFLTASLFAPRLFIYSLGAYLVADGLLDLYGVLTSKGTSRGKPLEYAGGAASLLSGLFSLVLPTLALLLLAALI